MLMSNSGTSAVLMLESAAGCLSNAEPRTVGKLPRRPKRGSSNRIAKESCVIGAISLGSEAPSPVKTARGVASRILKIQPQRPPLGVPQIQSDHVIETGAAPTTHLPQSRDTRPHFQNPASMPKIINFKLIRDRWARTNQETSRRASTFQNCGNSSRLVLRRNFPIRRDPGIVRDLVNRRLGLVFSSGPRSCPR